MTTKIGQYSAVSIEVAATLLGEELFEQLSKDKVRSLGPTSATIYPWNVVDYLSMKGKA